MPSLCMAVAIAQALDSLLANLPFLVLPWDSPFTLAHWLIAWIGGSLAPLLLPDSTFSPYSS